MTATRRDGTGVVVWTGDAPCGGSLQIRKSDQGLWHVTYRGFSRCTSRTLTHALAEATGANPEAAWLATIENAIQPQPQ